MITLYLLILIKGIQFCSWTYEEFVNWAITSLSKPELTETIKKVISVHQFNQSQQIIKLALVPFTIVFVFLFWNANRVIHLLNRLHRRLLRSINTIYNEITSLPLPELIALVMITLVYLVKAYWYVFHWPMQYDEAWTFNNFIKNSWIVPLTAPHNNHILYTLIAKFSYHWLPFLRPIEAIRFPLPLFGLFSAILLWKFICQYWNRQMALLVVALFLSCGPIIFYALYARAYLVGIFFNIVFLYSFIRYCETKSKFHFVLFCLGVVFSIYAIPTSIYFLVPTAFILGTHALIKNLALWKPILLSFLLTLTAVVLLYFPILITTKMNWLLDGFTANQFDFLYVFERFKRESGVFFSSMSQYKHWIFWVILFLSVIAILIANKRKEVFLLILVSFISPILYMLFQQKFLYTRLFSYNAIYYSILLAFYLNYFIKKLKILNSLIACFVFFFFSYYAHYQGFFNWSNQWDMAVEEVFETIVENDIDECYNFFFYAKPALEYYSYERESELSILMPQRASISYQPFEQKEWQSVLWYQDYNGERPNLTHYDLVWQKGELSFYIKKR